MKILFVGTFPFPSGTAGALRVKSLARSLHAAGNRVFVLSLVPAELNSSPAAGFKEINGILYKHISTIKRPSCLHKQRSIANTYNILSGMRFGKSAARQIILDEKIDKVIFYSWSAIEVEPILDMAKRMGLGVYADVVEFPAADAFRGGRLNPLYWNTRRLLAHSYLKVDGVIAISSRIENFYKGKGIPSIRVPALIEPDFFAGISAAGVNPQVDRVTLTYVGALAAKDDPLLMLNVFRILIQAGMNVELVMIGSIIKSAISEKFLSTCTQDEALKPRVVFTGRVSDGDLKNYLLSSNLLLLPRLKKPGVIAAFPTRLPELLLTGKPCVTTDVGDLNEYIQDGVHACLCGPGDAAGMAQKIISMIQDPQLSERIGSAGKERARTVFNFETYSQPLNSFLELKR